MALGGQQVDPAWQAAYMAKLAQLQQQLLNNKPAAEPPKRESKFLDQVQSAIDRQRIFRKRVAALVGGPVMIATAPVIGAELFRWWRWSGVDQYLCGFAGTVVGVGLMAVGATFIVGALLEPYYKNW